MKTLILKLGWTWKTQGALNCHDLSYKDLDDALSVLSFLQQINTIKASVSTWIFSIRASWHCTGWPPLVWPLLSACVALRFHCPQPGRLQSESRPYRAAAPRTAAEPLAWSTQPIAAFPDLPLHTEGPAPFGGPKLGWSLPELLPLWSKAPNCGLANTDPPRRFWGRLSS